MSATVPIYVTDVLFDRLRRLADREGTSPTFLAIHLLDEALDALGVPDLPVLRRSADDVRAPEPGA